MIYSFKCLACKNNFEKVASFNDEFIMCPKCGKYAQRQFHACTNMYIPSYFHTSKSDIFSDTEWADLKKNPNIERA